METLVSATSTFSGSHALKNNVRCSRDCGHTWTVTVTVTGDEDEEFYGFPFDEYRFTGALTDTTAELDGKNIDKMVKPSRSSEVGLAHWFYERFAMKYKVIEVTVWRNEKMQVTLRVP